MSETAVFYSLVFAGPDGTLLPYKGNLADKVRIPADSDVADFRDAVWKKNPNSLAGIDASQLKVLNAQSQPLEEDSFIAGLGQSKKQCLFVLVPEQEQGTRKGNGIYDSGLEDLITRTMKRVLDDAENDSAAKRSNPNRPGQKAFVARLAERDSRCPIMNTPKDGCVGAHIVGFDFWFKNQDIWDEEYKEFCYEWTHDVDDVRNGILMDSRLHRYFDNYFFTIYRNEDQFTIKVGKNLYPNDAEFANLDGQILSFGSKPCLWPHAGFLKFHNRRFTFNQMNAAAKPESFYRQDTERTNIHNFESVDYLKGRWLTEQKEITDYENFQEENDINI